MNNKTGRYLECIKTFKYDEIYLYSFKRNERYDISATTALEVVDNYIQDAILICICRETYDPIFFISPYFNFGNAKFEDVYFYCVPGKPALHNINDSYDGYEIYDNFLFEYIKTIPNTLMTPLKDDDNLEVGCYDKDGFLTKSIGNQQTCFFAIKNDSVYSGPLIYSQLSTFGPNIDFVTFETEPSCYTSVKNTTFKHNDSCIYIPSDSVFLCFCSKEQKNCRIQKEKLYCAPHVSSNTSYERFGSYDYKRMSVQTYFNKSVNYACGIKISTKNVTVKTTESERPKFEVEYISLNSCSNETTIDISESDVSKVRENQCDFKPDISLCFDGSYICELYHNLNQSRIYHHENFTTKIIHRTSYEGVLHIITLRQGLKPYYYECYYIYAEIINIDSKVYSEQPGSIKPFYRCTCQHPNCDAKDTAVEVPKTKFICQHLVKTDLENAKNGVKDFDEKDKWICYVQIDFYFEGSKINAGHLDIEKDKTNECFVRDIYGNDFCCVNIVNIEQKDTHCTVEKLLKQYNVSEHSKRNPFENHDANSAYITCLSKDILNFESESCPKTGGCFSTRITRPSGITSTDAIEPAGCLGYAEKYATLNLPITSLSLGCRTNENSNRCSVVYGPNGEQRIVCCCNENDGNGFCNTNLKEVPQSVGRSIKSFKSV
uniref:Uncharacterized protein n=1 Tax=Panagrolaimus sp. PS1159 TaxID=55785 RepID=A0AC35GTD2_9BILA